MAQPEGDRLRSHPMRPFDAVLKHLRLRDMVEVEAMDLLDINDRFVSGRAHVNAGIRYLGQYADDYLRELARPAITLLENYPLMPYVPGLLTTDLLRVVRIPQDQENYYPPDKLAVVRMGLPEGGYGLGFVVPSEFLVAAGNPGPSNIDALGQVARNLSRIQSWSTGIAVTNPEWMEHVAEATEAHLYQAVKGEGLELSDEAEALAHKYPQGIVSLLLESIPPGSDKIV